MIDNTKARLASAETTGERIRVATSAFAHDGAPGAMSVRFLLGLWEERVEQLTWLVDAQRALAQSKDPDMRLLLAEACNALEKAVAQPITDPIS